MNLDKCIELLKQGKFLSEKDLEVIVLKIKDILADEPNVLKIKSPITICGDIHGQLHDLLHIFKIGGEVPETRYLFMGDYVDRGFHSVETFSLLLCYKLKHPDSVFLIRGNHESRYATTYFGCYDEIIFKYGNSTVWKYFTQVFDLLPIAATIDDKDFCVHGGISPDLKEIDEINKLDRNKEVP